MGLFVTRRTYDDKVLELESDIVYVKNLNQALQERISYGEDYRTRLEKEICTTKAKNRELVNKVDALYKERDDKIAELEMLLAGRDKRIRELELMLGSFEARLVNRNDTIWENRKAREECQEAKAPRLPPLARDDRRRETC